MIRVFLFKICFSKKRRIHVNTFFLKTWVVAFRLGSNSKRGTDEREVPSWSPENKMQSACISKKIENYLVTVIFQNVYLNRC